MAFIKADPKQDMGGCLFLGMKRNQNDTKMPKMAVKCLEWNALRK